MRIKELREEKQISQKKLAEIIETSQRNIGRWENKENEPSYTQIVKLADFFGCSIDYLVGREDDFGVVQRNVSNGVNGGIIYNEDEKELLENFRRLSPNEHYGILIQTKALADKKLNLIKK